MPSADLGTSLIIALCIILIGWYAIGTILNRGRAQSFLRTLRPALSELGSRANFRWRTSAGLEVRILEPVEPFAEIAIQVMLEPREVLFLWLFNHFVRGRRDQFVLRAQLGKKPAFEFLLADARSALGQVFLEQARSKQMLLNRVSTRKGRQFEYSGRSRIQREWAEELLRGVEEHGWPVWVVSFHKIVPHLILVSGLPERDGDSLSQMFGLIRSVYRSRSGGAPAAQAEEDEAESLEDNL